MTAPYLIGCAIGICIGLLVHRIYDQWRFKRELKKLQDLIGDLRG